MKPVDDEGVSFDRRMRALHTASVEHVSSPTLGRLRSARHALAQANAGTRPASPRAWLGIGLASVLVAVVVGHQLQGPAAPAGSEAGAPARLVVEDETYPEVFASMDENPDLYLWLASSEAVPLAME